MHTYTHLTIYRYRSKLHWKTRKRLLFDIHKWMLPILLILKYRYRFKINMIFYWYLQGTDYMYMQMYSYTLNIMLSTCYAMIHQTMHKHRRLVVSNFIGTFCLESCSYIYIYYIHLFIQVDFIYCLLQQDTEKKNTNRKQA